MHIDAYPILRIDELLDRLAKAWLYSNLDLASGYQQIKMHEGHEYKIAFLMHYGTFEWHALPLGLTNAPVIF